METVSCYEAPGNIGWINEKFATITGVPCNKSLVLRLSNHKFAQPSPFTEPLVIAVDNASFNPLNHKGGLTSVSPEELLHAWYFAVERDILQKKPTSVIEGWLKMARSVVLHFEIMNSEDALYYRCFNMRESIEIMGQTLVRTALQNIFEVSQFKSRLEINHGRLTLGQLKDFYMKNTTQAEGGGEGSEKMSDDFFIKATYIYTKVLTIPDVRAILMWAEGNVAYF